MKNILQPILYGALFITSCCLFTTCSDNQNTTANAGEASQKMSGSSILGKSTEEKLDEFMMDYVNDLKAALAEPNDNKTIAMIQQMKEKYTPRAVKLKPEVEAWEKSMSEAEVAAFEKRAEQKPYFKELFTIGFGAMDRINKNQELEKAMDDLNNSINLVDEAVSPAEGEEELNEE